MKIPTELSAPGYALLKRSIIKASGRDAHRFLNGLVTNTLPSSSPSTCASYTAFLNPQGRMLYDAFIWRVLEDEFLIEADKLIGQDLMYHLRQYKLRSKIELEDISESYLVRASWKPTTTGFEDPRGGLGMQREIVKSDKLNPLNESLYKTLRFASGIPEGPSEIPRTQAIPLEYNIDRLGGVSFNKGCYLGQELVARTHNRGVIRKRLLPISFKANGDNLVEQEFDAKFPSAPAVEADVLSPKDGGRVGRVISTHGNLGMALLRLEALASNDHFMIPGLGLTLTAHIPSWLKL